MDGKLDLKELERKAFRSTYQDGLWDLYFGCIVMCMAVFLHRPASGYSPLNIILSTCLISAAYGLFWVGKKFITLPRMGQVQFGPRRQNRKRTLAVVLGVVVLVQVALIVFQWFATKDPALSAKLDGFLPGGSSSLLLVALLGSLFVGPSMILMAYFMDFMRGYWIAILVSLAVFLMIYLDRPLYPILIGLVIVIPGLFFFLRFLGRYPMPGKDPGHD